MDCERVKELINEYIDGELDEDLSKEITGHIKRCASCRAIKSELLDEVIIPLRKSERPAVPVSVWENIKERLPKGNTREARIWEYRGFPSAGFNIFRRPAMAALIGAAVLLAVFVPVALEMRSGYLVNTFLREQADFLSYLDNSYAEGENGYLMNAADIGTDIEEYFL